MAYIDGLGDVVRITMAASYRGSQIEEMNVFYQCAISGGTDSRPLLNAAVDSIVTTNLIPTMNGSMKYFGSRVSVEQAAVRPTPTVTTPLTAGGDGVASLPTQVRGLVEWHTPLIGRRQRGRIFVFTPAADWTDSDGNPSAALQTKYAAFATALSAGFTAAGSSWNLVIYHRPKRVPPTPFSVTAVNGFVVRTKFATQRRAGQLGRTNTDPW
jgi:hypothetical protein